ncbi:MAG: NFACT family protein, partial [Thermoplasmata archaeon]|nr:NFACT family protein [Thermoplasmata archaeon]
MKPKRSMSSFDLRAEVAELRSLEGAHFQKAFDPAPGAILIRLHLTGEGRANLLAQIGRFVLSTGREIETPSAPGHFSTLLRKHLGNAPVTAVAQHGFDRVVTFTFGRDPGIDLVIELFGKGNAILVREGRILGVHHSETWKDRTLKGGAEYAYPTARADPTLLDLEGLRASMGGGTDVVRALALGANLGGTYAEEVCLRAGIDKGLAPADLSDDQVESLHSALRGIIDGLAAPAPHVVLEAGKPVDVAPILLAVHDGMERVPAETFNGALDLFFDIEAPAEMSTAVVR